jgi:hypothetical protein
MDTVAAASALDRTDKSERVSLLKLAWVAPLTLVVALAVNLFIRFVVQTLSPSITLLTTLTLTRTRADATQS